MHKHRSSRSPSWRAALALFTLLAAHGAAEATRMVGDLPVRPAPVASQPAEPQPASGVVGAVRTVARGIEIEIGGRWWLVLGSRTAVLRDGRPVNAQQALAAGQTVRYLPASAAPGETALGVLHVP